MVERGAARYKGEDMLAVGTKLYGYCQGVFGRDSYSTKRIEAFGCDWVVARDKDGTPWFAEFTDAEDLLEFVKVNSVKPQDDDE